MMIRAFLTLAAGLFLLATATIISLHPVAAIFYGTASDAQAVEITDRHGTPLSASYQNQWNSFDVVPLYRIPEFLKAAFLNAEDRRYFDHGGIDWRARAAALYENIRALHRVRGASTVSEQVVHMLDPRPRTLWSKWLEGFEAMQLERFASKADLLEFYLNQIPYAANRRGVLQGARYYFNRDLSTLSRKEMLALAVLARSPARYDPRSHPVAMDAAIGRLAHSMSLSPSDRLALDQEKLRFPQPPAEIDVHHFVRYVRLNAPAGASPLRTTLDAELQQQVQSILDQRIHALVGRHVGNAAALVVDHQTGEILAWAVSTADRSNNQIDAALTPRQPGSALKPFLYTSALDRDWTPATIIDDAPMAEAVGTGLHRFRNYSNVYYGPVTLREALGNSLNIPAVRTIAHVGAGPYLTTLHRLGFISLYQSSDVYDEGLALGDGAVTLFEMVQGYAALAHHGLYRPLRFLIGAGPSRSIPIYSDEAASLIANILSDPYARSLEFGADSILNLPVQTAVKTGTSTEYRDAWTLGFNDRYVVGLWMGNLSGAAMDDVTGSTGPALAFRAIFAVINQNRETAPLYQSPRLVAADICTRPAQNGQTCRPRSELFRPGTMPSVSALPIASSITLIRPTDGLEIAYDPRVPGDAQKFRFEISGIQACDVVDWTLDGQKFETSDKYYLWPIVRGIHELSLRVSRNSREIKKINSVKFTVK